MTGEDKVTVATREYGKTREDICTFVFQPQVTASNALKQSSIPLVVSAGCGMR